MDFILIGKLEDYGFEENKNLRTKYSKTYIYKSKDSFGGQYYYNFNFIVSDDNSLIFDTDAYGVNEYDLNAFAKILGTLIKNDVIKTHH